MIHYAARVPHLPQWIAATVAAALVVALLGFAPASPAFAAVGESEPNSSTSTADPVPLGTAVLASMNTASYNDYDYFSFSAPSAGKLTLNLTFPSGFGTATAYDVSVYNATGTKLFDYDLTGDHSTGSWLASKAMYVAAGTFYVSVYGTDSRTSWGATYSLTASVAAGIVETEVNSATGTADAVALNTAMQGSANTASYNDYDYFSFTAPSAGKLTLNFTFPSGLGAGSAYDVAVYNSGGIKLFDFDITADRYSGTWLAAQSMFVAAGTFYVSVYGTDSRTIWGVPYSLTAGVTAGTVETEINSATGTADPIALGAAVLGTSHTASYNDYDYFSFTAASAGKLTLNFTFPSGLGTASAYDVAVYDSAGTKLFEYDLTGGQYSGSWLASKAMYVAAGTFYVSVYGTDSRATWAKTYSLKASVVAGAVETEINATTLAADTLTLGTTMQGAANTASYTDYDFYAFTVPADRKVRISFSFSAGSGSGYILAVLNSAGTVVATYSLLAGTASHADGSWLAANPISLTAGNYYIRIQGNDTWSTWQKPYALNVALKFPAAPTPVIAGTRSVGSILTAKTGAWSPAPTSFTYQWYRGTTAISGATSKTYTLKAADAGKSIKVKVTAIKTGYEKKSTTSSAVTIP